VLICGRRQPPEWGLPKGTPLPKESLEETARREVTEETGVMPQIKGGIGAIRYWFIRRRVRFDKTVHFYLMEPIGGSTELHDGEFDFVEWFPWEEACGKLSHDNEVEMVRKAVAMLTGKG
jgi:8-oxo-dGTP pyrophosphatase MutT (NUDIX family)